MKRPTGFITELAVIIAILWFSAAAHALAQSTNKEKYIEREQRAIKLIIERSKQDAELLRSQKETHNRLIIWSAVIALAAAGIILVLCGGFRWLPTLAVAAPKTIPSRIIARIFFGTYLGPFILWLAWGLMSYVLRDGIHAFPAVLMLTAWGFAIFPLGLTGVVSDGKDYGWLAFLSCYFVYLVLFVLAFRYRRRWQTGLLWTVLVVLLVFNVAGCQKMGKVASQNITLP